DPAQVVVEAVDRVSRSVVGQSAPVSVAVAEGESNQVVAAIRHIRKTEFVLPVADVLLRRLVILSPVVPAGVELVEDSRTERVIPAHAENVAGLLQIVIVR